MLLSLNTTKSSQRKEKSKPNRVARRVKYKAKRCRKISRQSTRLNPVMFPSPIPSNRSLPRCKRTWLTTCLRNSDQWPKSLAKLALGASQANLLEEETTTSFQIAASVSPKVLKLLPMRRPRPWFSPRRWVWIWAARWKSLEDQPLHLRCFCTRRQTETVTIWCLCSGDLGTEVLLISSRLQAETLAPNIHLPKDKPSIWVHKRWLPSLSKG